MITQETIAALEASREWAPGHSEDAHGAKGDAIYER